MKIESDIDFKDCMRLGKVKVVMNKSWKTDFKKQRIAKPQSAQCSYFIHNQPFLHVYCIPDQNMFNSDDFEEQ